jgi:hypothetical protein
LGTENEERERVWNVGCEEGCLHNSLYTFANSSILCALFYPHHDPCLMTHLQRLWFNLSEEETSICWGGKGCQVDEAI